MPGNGQRGWQVCSSNRSVRVPRTHSGFPTTLCCLQIARDVDGAGNYLMLTHRHVAQLHPLSGYALSRRLPEWVLFHAFSISENNYIRIASETSPELYVCGGRRVSIECAMEEQMRNLVTVSGYKQFMLVAA